jgi:glycosyltransferase involved in cell wall biosynthesis
MSRAPAPTISAIVVTYNRKHCLSNAIESILRQDPTPDEVIVVDDGSTDGTAEYVRDRYGPKVKLISQANGGVSAARRRGVLEATGDWIAFLDSDDRWANGRLALMKEAAATASAEVQWIFGDSEFVYQDGARSLFAERGWTPPAPVTRLADPIAVQYPYMFSLLPSSLVRKQALSAAGCFVENLATSEDLLVSFRIALMGHFICLRDVVTIVDRTGRSDSLEAQGERTPDYYRARVLAFDDFAKKLGRKGWGALHARAVRGWCIALARRGESCRAQALLQFKHVHSAKEMLFLVMAVSGSPLVRAWAAAGRLQGELKKAARRAPAVPIRPARTPA